MSNRGMTNWAEDMEVGPFDGDERMAFEGNTRFRPFSKSRRRTQRKENAAFENAVST